MHGPTSGPIGPVEFGPFAGKWPDPVAWPQMAPSTLQTFDSSPICFTDVGGSVVTMLQDVATYLVVGPFVAVLGGAAMALILLLRQRARGRRRPRT